MENYRIARPGTVTIRSKLDSPVLEHRASLGENLERQTNRFATLAAAIFPSPFVSFASRENLLPIYPPFYSLGYSASRVPFAKISSPPRNFFPRLIQRSNNATQVRPCRRRISSFFDSLFPLSKRQQSLSHSRISTAGWSIGYELERNEEPIHRRSIHENFAALANRGICTRRKINGMLTVTRQPEKQARDHLGGISGWSGKAAKRMSYRLLNLIIRASVLRCARFLRSAGHNAARILSTAVITHSRLLLALMFRVPSAGEFNIHSFPYRPANFPLCPLATIKPQDCSDRFFYVQLKSYDRAWNSVTGIRRIPKLWSFVGEKRVRLRSEHRFLNLDCRWPRYAITTRLERSRRARRSSAEFQREPHVQIEAIKRA